VTAAMQHYEWKRLVYSLDSGPPQRGRNGWLSGEPSSSPTGTQLESYEDLAVIVLLGERGVGKSDIVEDEARRLLAAGADCRLIDLAEHGNDEPGLTSALEPPYGEGPYFVFLDSVDEAIDNDRAIIQVLARCLRNLQEESRGRLRLRVSCRSSRWPTRLRTVIAELWPDVAYMGVAGLTRADVLMAAEQNGLDASFVTELERRRLVVPLASWPVTLIPLLEAAAAGEPLPEDAAAAFAQACRRLCTETNPAQRDVMTADSPSPGALLSAGRRVAAAIQFGAQHALADTSDDGPGVSLADLAGGTEPDEASSAVACSERLLRKLTESALLTPLGPRRWGFAHHSFQEYLAARYLSVHQVSAQVRQAILLAGDGPSRHAVASQREVAAWLSVDDNDLFEELLECDPEVLLLADPAARPGSDRGRLTDALLALASRDSTVQLDPLLLYRLEHPGLAAQLAPHLDPCRPPNEVYAALMIARACPQGALTGELLAIAEGAGQPDGLRSLAVEAVATDDTAVVARLLRVAESAPPDLAGAVLIGLWPEHLSASDLLRRVPVPQPYRFASAWALLRAIPRMLRPGDLIEALSWTAQAMRTPSPRDHVELAVKILAWVARTYEPASQGLDAEASNTAATLFAETLAALASSGNIDEDDLPLQEIRAALEANPGFRRAVDRILLDVASAGELSTMTIYPLGIFPRADAAYWALQLPSLSPGPAEKLTEPLRRMVPDNYADWAAVWEQAQGNELIRKATETWYQVTYRPSPRARREPSRAQQPAHDAPAAYDEPRLRDALEQSAAGDPATVRQHWARAVIELYRPSEDDRRALSLGLDLPSAPNFPSPGTELHALLVRAAEAVLGSVPALTTDQLSSGTFSLSGVSELWAIGLLEQGGRHPSLDGLNAAHWAALTLALTRISTSDDETGVRARLLAIAVNRAGHIAEEEVSQMLGGLGEGMLAIVMDRLGPALTPGLTSAVNEWALGANQSPVQRELAVDALVRYGQAEPLQELRARVPLQDDDPRGDPGGTPGQQWISDAIVAVRRDSADHFTTVMASLTKFPELSRPFLDRLVSDYDLDLPPLDLRSLKPRELADLYELAATHEPGSEVAFADDTGEALFGPDQRLARFSSQIVNVIAEKSDRDAASELQRLANQYPDHWQLRETARLVTRQVAEQSWQPVSVEELLKITADTTLRLVRDEHQLSAVVTESLARLQHLLSVPNGWVTLLWHKEEFDATNGGWWPAWEEDLSDLVATFLQHDLASRQVIVNREVQIVRPGLTGQRTDIHVQANPSAPGTDAEPLTVIIECKGCWNSSLATALSTQLVDQYLSQPGRNAGIYLIGYFDNGRWDHGKHPGREHTAHSITDLSAQQEATARDGGTGRSVDVTSFILDCRLPEPASTATSRRPRQKPSAGSTGAG
jgi:hypothetical protein